MGFHVIGVRDNTAIALIKSLMWSPKASSLGKTNGVVILAQAAIGLQLVPGADLPPDLVRTRNSNC